MKSKLKTSYAWLKASDGEFDVNINLNNFKSVEEVSEFFNTVYFEENNYIVSSIENAFKQLNGVKTFKVKINEAVKRQLSYHVYLTYEDSIIGPEIKNVKINIKNNLTASKLNLANKSVLENISKYKSKIKAKTLLKLHLQVFKGFHKLQLHEIYEQHSYIL
ncbi:hypothetical protein [Mesoplasma melaleucae]|uniref:hypothetical protein n=1 Tax=Mesoplasma melaleucae TaxID=81459 RepID=UPI0004884709|nr:hypothetical protein [Mesoplasma melaleucae]